MPKDKNKKSGDLCQAIRDGDRKKIKELLDGETVNARNPSGLTPLIVSCQPLVGSPLEGQRLGMVADLLSAGAEVNAVDANGKAALHHAASGDYDEVVAKLLDFQARLEITDNYGATALHFAARGDAPMAIKTLLERGADINCQDQQGRTPLYMAAHGGYPATVRMLIKGNADVHMADKSGNTPLHVAAGNGREIAVIGLLCGYGANIHTTNNAGKKPLHYAQLHGHDKIADILIGGMANTGGIKPAPSPKDKSKGEVVYNRAFPSVVSIAIPTNTGDENIIGGGVIVMPGIVATNYHVVKRHPSQIKVIWGQRSLSAEIRAKVPDDDYDFCLLEVSGLAKVEPTIQIRPSHTLRIGEDVYAIGNPKGETRSLSAGVIAHVRKKRGRLHMRRQIQTDAAISPGSSGGGLFDCNGNLIGITTSMHSDERAQNINYAISADLVFGYDFGPSPEGK